MVEPYTLPDYCCFTDDDTGAGIDEETVFDARCRMMMSMAVSECESLAMKRGQLIGPESHEIHAQRDGRSSLSHRETDQHFVDGMRSRVIIVGSPQVAFDQQTNFRKARDQTCEQISTRRRIAPQDGCCTG